MWKTTMWETTKLTIELRDIVENGVDIWDFDYPSYYKDTAKKEFERKVIDHYYFRQIGQETVGRFKHYFKTKIREIMPYYIELYKTAETLSNIDDIFGNIDITETYEEESSGTASGSSSGTSSASGTSSSTDTKNSTDEKTHKFSNTPQGTITNIESYMSEASKDDTSASETVTNDVSTSSEGDSSSSSESSQSGTVRHTLHRKGNQGVNTYAHDMIEFRQTILNIDMQIINELNDLFLGVY